jgi:hypothetical protein
MNDSLIDLVVRGSLRNTDPGHTELVEKGLATSTVGTLIPTAEGVTAASELLLLADEDPTRSKVESLYEAFLPQNNRLKQLCTEWQRLPDGSPNDHSDIGYDVVVRDRLEDIHEAVTPLLRLLASVASSGMDFLGGLARALERLDAGENEWFTSPRIDSYHTVWMHVHQQLLLLLGISRPDDAQRELDAVQRNQ